MFKKFYLFITRIFSSFLLVLHKIQQVIVKINVFYYKNNRNNKKLRREKVITVTQIRG